MIRSTVMFTAMVAAVLGAGPAAAQANCTHTFGSVMELTGPAGRFGQAASKSIELALRDLNAAGTFAGCALAVDLRDSQSQGTVAVDQAKQLVDVRRVPAIIGGIISAVSIPILTSVTASAGVVQISPASSSPTLTQLGRDGRSQGWFFRTITSDALQGVAAAKYALDSGIRRVSIVHVNNDFGVNMVREFSRYFTALGGVILTTVPYQPQQASYAPEVTRANRGNPDALYLVSYPGDGTSIARTWVQQGGVQRFLLNDGMNDASFIRDVGPQFLNAAIGTSSGTTPTASSTYFAEQYNAFAGPTFNAQAPAADRAFDATMILGLAIAHAGKFEAAAIRDSIRKVLDPQGEVIHAGQAGIRKALELIAAGKPVRYEGVIGPVQFDQNGDITGPFRKWAIRNGEIATVGQMSVEEVREVQGRLR
ncbi:MAG: amino acid ABC transporter substrate-binding protein [Alphaproteobacteria bacterium]|nr:MAG: amino acid ABC transporter substrate-binding protein [Alphaproteobacteria bacterium]